MVRKGCHEAQSYSSDPGVQIVFTSFFYVPCLFAWEQVSLPAHTTLSLTLCLHSCHLLDTVSHLLLWAKPQLLCPYSRVFKMQLTYFIVLLSNQKYWLP